jgi:hypothetical protein
MVKIKSGHPLTKKIIQGIKWCWLKLVLPCLQFISRIVRRFWKVITRDKQFFFVFLITVTLIIGLLLFGILPTSQNFEGNLLVSSLSFTSNESNHLLLKDVSNLQEITISGIQKFTLSGTFTNPSNPKLDNLQQLAIELPNENSLYF